MYFYKDSYFMKDNDNNLNNNSKNNLDDDLDDDIIELLKDNDSDIYKYKQDNQDKQNTQDNDLMFNIDL